MTDSIQKKYKLSGHSLIAGKTADAINSTQPASPFHAYHPADGRELQPAFFPAALHHVNQAVSAAVEAASLFAALTGRERASLLRRIADGIDASAAELIERAHLETALPLPRLTGEVVRTSGQMRLFASVLEEGSWVMARIDTADPARTPPKPDIRSMLRPLGPVVVFGASNFPLAFSVAGGDTASALAAGNPVIVKAHPAHPGTSEIMARILIDAIHASALPAGIFSMLFDSGYLIGAALVQHPDIRAVGFTGSLRGGRALMDLAAARPHPIPVYAEMGSTNPVFILPRALAERAESLATGLHGSFTLGGGQFCTKPGLVFSTASHDHAFTEQLRASTKSGPSFKLLTSGIAANYNNSLSARENLRTASGESSALGFSAQPTLIETTAHDFFADSALAKEVFGPTTLLVHCNSKDDLLKAATELEGHLTATVLATDEDLLEYAALLRILETKAGRVIVNAFPTGVEVCHSMVHGGPYPATSDGRSTSVGSLAILRFTRSVAYQGVPQKFLPPELHDDNPLAIKRMWNGSVV